MQPLEPLIAASIKGDMEAFNHLYEYSYPVVEHECLKILRNSFDAEDAIQESYIIIYKKLGSLKEPDKFLGWCRVIAHNTSVNYIAKRDRKAGKDEPRPPVSDDNYTGMDMLDGEDTEVTPEEKAEQDLVKQYLQKALDNIAPAQSLCLALHQQGYTYNQISEITALPVGTCKSNVHYAKTALKKEIRRIEQKENIQIHGFVIVPAAGRAVVQMAGQQSGGSSGFIQADTPASSGKDDIWDNLVKELPRSAASGMPLWRKIVAIAVAAVIIVGGIVLAVNRAGHTNFATRQNTVSSTQGSRQQGSRAGRQRLAPSSRNVPGANPGITAAGPAGAGGTATRVVTATARQNPEPAPQTAGATTREVFTNEARNMGNALAGN